MLFRSAILLFCISFSWGSLGEVAFISLIFLLYEAEYVLAYSVVHNVNHRYSLKFLVAMFFKNLMKLILKDF